MKIIFLIFLLYFLFCVYLYLTQENKIFNRKFAQKAIPQNAKHIFFTTSEGLKLEGGFVENKKNAPLVLYFSGNSNNVLEFLDNIAPKIKDYNFIGFNYPGYASSQGKPCESCIYKYALEIFDKYKPSFLMGRSLGSAVSSFVGANRKVKGILLITPIDSILNIAKHKYPFLPISILLKHKFEAINYLKKIDSPISVLLVKNDETVPQKNIQNVINSIKNLKETITISGVKHANVYEYKDIHKIIQNLLRKLDE